MIIKLIFVYVIIAFILTFNEYKTVKRTCRSWDSPKLDYCFIRGFFFPLVIIKKVFDYIIKQ